MKYRPSIRHNWLHYLVLCLMLTGCTLPQDPAPPQQGYLLQVHNFPPLAATSKSKRRVLLVNVSKTAPGFDSRNIAYTSAPPKLDYYRDSVWSDTPANMLQPILVQAFERTGAFKAVVAPPAPGLADVRVDVDVVRLQQEFMTRPSQVRIVARLKVVDMKTRHVLDTRLFEAVAPAPSDDAAGAAQAAGVALERLLSEMLPFALKSMP